MNQAAHLEDLSNLPDVKSDKDKQKRKTHHKKAYFDWLLKGFQAVFYSYESPDD